MADGSDHDLLTRWRAGDRRAGNILVRRHFPRVRSYFVGKGSSDHEDLVQETFARMVGSRDTFRGEASFRTYLFRIARYVFAEHLRRRYRRRGRLQQAYSSMADVFGRRPSSMLAELEHHGLLREALRELSIDDQDLLELYYWQGLLGREIASLFALKQSTVRSRIRAALARLRKAYLELSSAPHKRDLSIEQLERWLEEMSAHGCSKDEDEGSSAVS